MHSMEEMTRAGCTSRRGVRYWEDQGLLGDVKRSDGGTRQYTAEQLDRADYSCCTVWRFRSRYDQAHVGRLWARSV